MQQAEFRRPAEGVLVRISRLFITAGTAENLDPEDVDQAALLPVEDIRGRSAHTDCPATAELPCSKSAN